MNPTGSPNIVVILTDTQPPRLLGCYGNPPTPHLDALAASGARYERAYTCSPVCSPARAALFTGLSPQRAGVLGNSMALARDVVHMGEYFQALGYQTCYSGKWHLDGHDYFGDGKCPNGWDPEFWYDGLCYLKDLGEEKVALWRSGLPDEEALRRHGIDADFTMGSRTVDRALRFLETRDTSRPFLLVVSIDEPHHPATCPPEFCKGLKNHMHDPGPSAQEALINKPRIQADWAAASGPWEPSPYNDLYFACNRFADFLVGRVTEAVKKLSPGNTYTIFTSDHGDALGAHGLKGKGPAMYEEIIRVPLLVSGPGIPAGSVDRHPISHLDLLPSLLHLAGTTPPPSLLGNSKRLGGPPDAPENPRAVISHNRFSLGHGGYGGFFPIRCLVTERYKLALNLFDTDELYDLEADPQELTNQIENPSFHEIRQSLHQDLLAWMEAQGDPLRGWLWLQRPWNPMPVDRWTGKRWIKSADGFAPPFRSYETGKPAGPENPG